MDKMNKKAMTQIERNKKYKNNKNIKRLSLDLKPSELAIIDNLKRKWNTTNKSAILQACKYCIDNNINLTATDSRAEDK